MRNRHKMIIIVLLLTILFSILYIPSFESAINYYTTDSKSGEIFNVTDNDGEITITGKGKSSTIFIDCQIIDLCSYDGILTFLCSGGDTSGDSVYIIYTYNIVNGYLSSFATDCKANKNNGIFAADGIGNVYILSAFDSTLIHCYKSGINATNIKCPANITQIMCVQNDTVLLFTVDGVYSHRDNSTSKLSSLVPVTPCVYSGDGIITDNVGDKYIIGKDEFYSYQNTTESSDHLTINDRNISIDHTEKQIRISAGMSVNGFYNFLNLESGKIKILNPDGSDVSSGNLGTGMSVLANETTYYIIVKGDLTGEGNVNSRDLKALMKHLTKESELSGIFLIAADLNEDKSITTKDLLELSKLY